MASKAKEERATAFKKLFGKELHDSSGRIKFEHSELTEDQSKVAMALADLQEQILNLQNSVSKIETLLDKDRR